MTSKRMAAGAEERTEVQFEKNGPARNPSTEEIRQRAYEIHIERGGGHGRDLEDWLQAERELIYALIEIRAYLLDVDRQCK